MGKKIVIIDYGLGNIYSISQACKYVGYNTILSSDKEEIMSADSIILPGVGAYKVAMESLEKKGLTEIIKEYGKTERPLMGVCLGMQLLLESSEEFGRCNGLGLVKGVVKKFPEVWEDKSIKIPHIGWNKVFTSTSNDGKSVMDDDVFMYFVHSYYVKPENSDNILSTSIYENFKFCSAIQKSNIFGFQFHPEKSGEQGLNIYKNFLSL